MGLWLFDEIVGNTVYDEVFMNNNGEKVGLIATIVSAGSIDKGL